VLKKLCSSYRDFLGNTLSPNLLLLHLRKGNFILCQIKTFGLNHKRCLMIDDEKLAELEKAQTSDPRTSGYGCFLGSASGWDGRLLFWHESIEAFKYALLELHPIIYDVEGDELDTYQIGLKEIFDNATSDEITEEMLIAMNENSKTWLAISWYGKFDELTRGDTEFAKEVRESYRETDDYSPIENNEIEDFIEFLKTFGV
jgi:hypothetical protein